MEFLATSTFGLETIVRRELETLGYKARTVSNGRIEFSGNFLDLLRANLWLRTADRILLVVGRFSANDFGQLFDQTYALPWEQWIGPDGQFPVRGRSVKSQLSSVPACQKIVKKAIVEKLRAAHKRETLPETGPLYTVEVALLNDMATLTIDTSGAGLNKRGYRTLVGMAPLKETLAAAMIQLSFWNPDRPLLDPFCGSGTIPIEAAMIGRNIAPGRWRSFTCESWPQFPAEVGVDLREEIEDVIKPGLGERIIGMDMDGQQLGLARTHAKQADVLNDIHFQRQNFEDLTSPRQYGCLICNPPYGQRLNETHEVRQLYRQMPEVLRQLKTWSFYILTSFPDFERLIGQPANRRRKLYNGNLECTYYQYFGPKPGEAQSDQSPEAEQIDRDETAPLPSDSQDTVKPTDSPAAKATRSPRQATTQVFGGLNQHAHQQAEMFGNRLKKNARHLRKWPARGISCYRIYDRDIPEIPFAVDLYEGRLHMAEYERPHERSIAEHADWLDYMVTAAAKAMDIPADQVFLKRRRQQKGAEQYEKFNQTGHMFTVTENALTFYVNLADYLDTGLFLDHRQTRVMARDEAAGKRVLNLFAYTGAFSVYAAAGGAKSVTTVDLSNTYLDWARQNMAVNGFTGPQYRFVRDDVMGFLTYHKPGRAYDLVVLDPPTFSNSKRNEQDFEVQRDYLPLLQELAKLMTPDGVVYFSNNFRQFKLDESAVVELYDVREITKQTIPADFRNKRIHRCWRLTRRP